jgi:murein DD-endopeptidase MepM/ murein hydrolase activator NlpD
MRRSLAAAAAGILALMLMHGPAAVASTPPPCPSPTAASSSRTCVNPTPDPYAELQQRLGGDLAKALSTQHKLVNALGNASATELALSGELTLEESRVADLQNQVDQLDRQISDLESRIDAEREQIAALARAMYQRPTSILDIIASSGNLSDMLSQTTDMLVAGQRAHALQDKLQADLTQAQADRDARQSDLDQESATMEQVQAGLVQLSGVQTELNSLSAQLGTLLAQIRAAAANLKNVPVDDTDALATLLEQEESTLAQAEQAAAWAQAGVGTGLAADQNLLPAVIANGTGGIGLNWPMTRGVVTQGFGPTSFVLEPPLGPYAHFHTGIDISAALGTPVVAAAAGIVVAVAHTAVGYGNYVIIAHGSGLLTLYGHLLQTHVVAGQAVAAGQVIGNEGSTGYSTGPHVHFEVRINGQVTDPMRFLPPL